ncbi:UbiA family prenyltransferase [Streptomyces zaomyceticus]|uniref:UbiA family prenyltransferase n=1 Tax=Streptomyces zaomyceticus TaxID=68286 RepID=UPI002E136421|nr:UbiA family prenyltransferase [Streptomyces zaomyceticus]
MSPHDRRRDYLAPVSLYLPGPPVRATHRLATLLHSCHPEPTLAVTMFVTALAAMSGRGPVDVVAVGAAVLAGQLSIGWCNDAVDAGRDTASGRRDKPVAAGALRRRTAAMAAVVALVVCVPLSLLSGLAAAAVHLTGVIAGGWAYNLALKRTPLSPVPYAVGFASLPVFVTLGPPSHAWPAWWAVVTSALLGVGAHWVNALPDIADDLATGVRGLPQRLGPVACRRLSLVTMLAAVAIVTVYPPGTAGAPGWVCATAAGCAAAVGTVPRWREGSRWPFRAAIAVAGLAVVQLLSRGSLIV